MGWQASSEETKAENQEENLITEEVRFTVTNDNITAENNIADQRTVGSLAVTRKANTLQAQKKPGSTRQRNSFTTWFPGSWAGWSRRSLRYTLAETILEPDGTGNISTYVNSAGETIVLEKDALIDTIETDWTGTAWIHNLPLGSYYFKEAAAGDGFLLNPEIIYADLDYADQDTPVVVNDGTRYENQRQRVEIELLKKGKLAGVSVGDAPEGSSETEEEGQAVFGAGAGRQVWPVRGGRHLCLYRKPRQICAEK